MAGHESSTNRHSERRPNAVWQARRRPCEPLRAAARDARRGGRARALGRRARGHRLRRHGRGAPGRRRPDPLAPGVGRDRARPDRRVGDDQQGVRVGHAGRDAGRRHDPGGRARRHPGRGDGVDVERALPASQGPVRLRPGRRGGARLDDLRRPHLHLRRLDHGRAELRRGRRGRDLARGAGRLGAALARAGRRCHRRRALRRGDRAGDDPGPQGRDGRRYRRGPAPRYVARAARRAQARLRRRRLDHGRERARRERRRRCARARVRGLGEGARDRPAGRDPRARLRRRRLRLPRADAGGGDAGRAREGRAGGLRHRPARGERGVLLGRAQHRAAARDRRGARERERRRGGARAPDRRVGRAPARHARLTSFAAAGGGIGVAAICSGAAQGDATVLEVFPP